jgi:single-strand DNA-binding protein
MSHISFAGNMTREATLRYTGSGLATCSFSVAESFKPKSGEERTTFYNVTAFGSLAESIVESLPKGTRVVVTGRMESRKYEKDGEQKTVWEVIADEVGPSLRWATAVVSKTERSTTGATSRPSAQPAPSYADMEEPFLLDAHVDTVPSRRLFGGIQ